MISKGLNLFGFANSQVKEKFDSSMQLVDEMRVSPFFPLEKISHNSKLSKDFKANGNRHIRQTSWGTVEIRNRLLTQNHLEIFSAIMAHKKESKELKSGRVAIYFSMFEISQVLGLKWGGRTSRELEQRIQEIADTRVLRTINDNKDDYRIVENVAFSEKHEMWGIVLSAEYSELFKRGVTIGYKKRLEQIIAIEGKGAGLIKAVINFFITHDSTKQHRITLLQLLDTIAYPTEQRQLRTAIETLNRSKDILSDFNIIFYNKDKILEYNGAEHIKFLPALPLIK
jgi:hypothetical protein